MPSQSDSWKRTKDPRVAMPTISVFYGIVIEMYWREHGPPHFHAIC